MVIEYNLTLDDLKEAQIAHARAEMKARGAAGGRTRVILIVSITLLLAVILLAAAGLMGGGSIAIISIALACLMIVFLLMLVLRVIGLGRKGARPVEQFVRVTRLGPLQLLRGLFGWILFVTMAIVLYMLLQKSSAPSGPATAPAAATPDLLFGVLVPLIPWLVLFASVWVILFTAARVQMPRRMWERNPALQLRQRLDANDDRLIIDNVQSRIEMKWAAVRSFLETPNLFMLYTAEYLFHMVPKRAFAGQGEAEFRELLRRGIQPPTQAFPVMQAVPVAPLPIPPLPPHQTNQ